MPIIPPGKYGRRIPA